MVNYFAVYLQVAINSYYIHSNLHQSCLLTFNNQQSTMEDFDADGIKHTTLKINGINTHIAEKGSGPTILFLHGFPELWYSWRHQILTLSSLGYRAVAPDMRGYGDTDAPTEASEYTFFHLVGDAVGVMDAIGEEKVFVVGHDWGAMVAWYLCLFRPDRVKALFNLSVPFGKWDSGRVPVEELRAGLGEDYYVSRFQVPGEMEAEIEEAGGSHKFLTKLFSMEKSGAWFLPKNNWFNNIPPLPTWISDKELAYYANKFHLNGFTGGFNYYRTLNLSWSLLGAWAGAKVTVPTKFVIGDLDICYQMPGMKEYLEKGKMKEDVPLLKELVVMEGVGHFLQQERPEEISNQIGDFFRGF